jgi:hypothetical protein
MLEIGTSGTVRGGGGNILTYSEGIHIVKKLGPTMANARQLYPRIAVCAVLRRGFPVGGSPTRQGVAPAGSNCSDEGGDEIVEAYDGKGHSVTLRACRP